jgi:hypothetical protein
MSDINNLDAIKAEFTILFKDNKIGYYISLEHIYRWLEMPNKYKEYCENPNARNQFKTKFLINTMLSESRPGFETCADYIMHIDNNIEFPWFSIDGFHAFSAIQNSKRARDIYSIFSYVKEKYYQDLHQINEKQNAAILVKKAELAKLQVHNFTKHREHCTR